MLRKAIIKNFWQTIQHLREHLVDPEEAFFVPRRCDGIGFCRLNPQSCRERGCTIQSWACPGANMNPKTTSITITITMAIAIATSTTKSQPSARKELDRRNPLCDNTTQMGWVGNGMRTSR